MHLKNHFEGKETVSEYLSVIFWFILIEILGFIEYMLGLEVLKCEVNLQVVEYAMNYPNTINMDGVVGIIPSEPIAFILQDNFVYR